MKTYLSLCLSLLFVATLVANTAPSIEMPGLLNTLEFEADISTGYRLDLNPVRNLTSAKFVYEKNKNDAKAAFEYASALAENRMADEAKTFFAIAAGLFRDKSQNQKLSGQDLADWGASLCDIEAEYNLLSEKVEMVTLDRQTVLGRLAEIKICFGLAALMRLKRVEAINFQDMMSAFLSLHHLGLDQVTCLKELIDSAQFLGEALKCPNLDLEDYHQLGMVEVLLMSFCRLLEATEKDGNLSKQDGTRIGQQFAITMSGQTDRGVPTWNKYVTEKAKSDPKFEAFQILGKLIGTLDLAAFQPDRSRWSIATKEVFREAEQAYVRMAKSTNRSRQALGYDGLVCLKKICKEPNEACLLDARTALSLDPTVEFSLYACFTHELEKNDLIKARAIAQKSIDFKPTALGYRLLMSSYIIDGNFKKIDEIKKQVDKSWSSLDFMERSGCELVYALSLALRQNWTESAKLLERLCSPAENKASRRLVAHYNLAVVRYKQGSKKAALNLLMAAEPLTTGRDQDSDLDKKISRFKDWLIYIENVK